MARWLNSLGRSSLTTECSHTAFKCALSDDHRLPVHVIVDVNGVAAPCHADAGNVDGRRAIAANHVLPVLVVTLRTANPAGVKANAHAVGGVKDSDQAQLTAFDGNNEMV